MKLITGRAARWLAVTAVLFASNPGAWIMMPESAAAATIAITVDAGAGRKPISPYIYGLNYATEAFANEIALPVRRWGGNLTSRYNWQINATNHASDFHFENSGFFDDYTSLPQTADDWVKENKRTGAASILTMPMLNFVAKDTSSCGFNSRPSKYDYTPKPGTFDDISPGKTHCADGIRDDNTLVTGNDPLDTSLFAGPDFAAGWVDHLKATHGAGGVQMYSLDNEPDGWNETHRDVHPAPVDYDELMDRTIAYAASIKLADPAAKILGFSPTNWYGYFYSRSDMIAAAANGYTEFPDLESHDDLFMYEYYLQQLRDFEASNGIRLIDYFDVHFYPQNITGSEAGSATMKANRLESVRSLWDPTYNASGEIGGGDILDEWEHARLIPRLKEMVAANYPGTKLALSEYNFGGLEDINGALAQADILGTFGREGLDLATLWNNIYYGKSYTTFSTLPGAYAFRMFRNYDGAGGKFGDTSVKSATADQAQLAVHSAVRTGDGALTIMVINKTATAHTATIALGNYLPTGTATVHRYSPANLSAIVKEANQTVTAAGLSATVPPSSITMFTVAGKTAPPPVFVPRASR